MLLAAVLIGGCSGGSGDDRLAITVVREELLGHAIDIPGSDGHRYAATDHRGHVMDAAKVIQIGEDGELAAVYHWWSDETQSFTSSLATSEDLLEWTWRVDLAHGVSMPTIAAASDGGYVVAWEDDTGPRVGMAHYPSWEALLAAEPAREFTAERLLSECAEGTPNIYSASSEEVVFGLHFGCETARQARGTTDWSTWTVEEQPLLDRAALLQGYRGLIGDRDVIEYEGHTFTFLEAQFIQDDWRTFRVILYDDDLGAADRAGFPDAPAVPPSAHVFLHTHLGSSAFTNFTVSEVTLDGRRTLVMSVFIPQEGARGDEAGQLIYYRFVD